MEVPDHPSISSYGVLGDGNTIALVSREGAIEWWCAPRVDSPSVFGRMLDPVAGHWTIQPVGGSDGAPVQVTTERSYLPGTLVLCTRFRTATGAIEVTDALALGRSEPHAIGRGVAPCLVRLVRGVAGEVDLASDVQPRFAYGTRTPQLEPSADGVELIDPGGKTRLWFTSDRPVEVTDFGVHARLRLRAGEQAGFSLATGRPGPAGSVTAQLDETIGTWRRWSDAHDRYEGVYADAVRTSSLVLQSLTYQPTGAVVASATTSLPEVWGGSANWDYRYAWLRDAAMVVRALWVGACPDEVDRYFAWMADAVRGPVAGHPDGPAADAPDDRAAARLQIVYDVHGGRDLTESELPWLHGYRGSRPVRVGNDAWTQRQLDVPGEVLDAAWTMRDRLTDGRAAGLLRQLANTCAATWTEPDAGIWEGREGERDYLSSKLMCWVALDRAVRLAERIDASAAETRRWATERERVRRRILTEGWNDQVGAFTGAFGSDHLDASVLLTPLVGFLADDDPRVVSTVAAVEKQLSDGGLVRRWTGADDEGAFVMCSYWLAQCHARAGQVDRAAEIFEHVTGHANDLGILAEMIDPPTGEPMGNVPQALSHAALVCAAWSIDQAAGKPNSDARPHHEED
jgi:GH15 family glucan-1,4-alpha-glucosidase